jgi:uncharacterized phage protein (TIGR02218 family)
MTFKQYEQDQERGAPINIFEFIAGDQTYKYCSATGYYQGATPIPISAESVKTQAKFEKTELVITLPVDTDLARLFLPYPPPYVVRVIMRQMHLTDPSQQALAVWTGRVLTVGREKDEAKLTCDSTILSFKRPGLRRNFQHGCPLLLYGQGLGQCNVNREGFKVTTVVEDINPDGSLQLPVGWNGAWASDKFRGGMIKWVSSVGQETRGVIATTDTTIKFGGLLREIVAGDTITLYLGCRHDLDDCRDTFANAVNYGGQPWIPFKNPIKQHPYW